MQSKSLSSLPSNTQNQPKQNIQPFSSSFPKLIKEQIQLINITLIHPYQTNIIMINRSDKNFQADYFTLDWRNITLRHKKSEKIIIQEMGGRLESGDFLTIMGPSGAGKTSLLSVLSNRMKSLKEFQMLGSVFINNNKFTANEFSKVAVYVSQDDLLFGTLTVKETFQFHARLKLWAFGEDVIEGKCRRIMKMMNLTDCQNSLIGNGQFKKSISGGQKKRVAIGVELLSDPSILIFDEPTSGLDSHNALSIINLLKRLAREQHKMIITTLHQPSSLMFQNLDLLYLVKGGECVYNGRADKIVDYMTKIGININYRMNPADFFMMELSQAKINEGYVTPFTALNFSQRADNYSKNEMNNLQENSTTFTGKSLKEIKSQTPFFKQFSPLIHRSFKAFIRTPSNQLNKIVAAFIIPLVLGVMYIGAADGAPADINKDPSAFNKFALTFPAFIFMSSYFVFAMNTYDTVLVFPQEKELVLKEVASNLYSILSYYFARLIAQFLGCIIPGIISAVLLYFLINMEMTAEHFIFFIGIFTFLAFQGYIFGIFFGVACKDTNTAVNLLPIFFITFLIVSGLPCNLNDIPSYISWLQYLSPTRHGFFILMLDQIKTSKINYFGNEVAEYRFGIHGDIYEPLYWQLALFSFYFIGSIVLLYIMKHRM